MGPAAPVCLIIAWTEHKASLRTRRRWRAAINGRDFALMSRFFSFPTRKNPVKLSLPLNAATFCFSYQRFVSVLLFRDSSSREFYPEDPISKTCSPKLLLCLFLLLLKLDKMSLKLRGLRSEFAQSRGWRITIAIPHSWITQLESDFSCLSWTDVDLQMLL